MIEISQKNYHQITDFFDQNTPNFPIVMSVLEKRNPGRVWMNQLESPSTCLIITNGSYSFISKKNQPNKSTVLDIIRVLKNNKPIKLIWEINDPLFYLFRNAGFTSVERIQFYNPIIADGDTTRIDAICSSLPNDCEIKTINAELLKKSHWLSYIKLFYGSEGNFLKNGFGLVLIKNKKLVSEAFACYIGGGLVETGSVTSAKYRGKGYATIIRAFLIKEILSRNLQPVTSCNLNNLASVNASTKLGFKEKIKYQFLVI